MPTRGVFCLTGQDASGGTPVDYSTDSVGSIFEKTNTNPLSSATKAFYTIRYNSSVSQWIATGNIGLLQSSRIFYSDDAYNWSQSAYTNGGPFIGGNFTSQGTIFCGEYGKISDASSAWLCYGATNNGLVTNTTGISFSNPANSSTYIENHTTYPSGFDMSGVVVAKLRNDSSTNWLSVYNKQAFPGNTAPTGSKAFYINSAGTPAGPAAYTYTDISNNIAPAPLYGTAGYIYTGAEYSSSSTGGANKWAVCGSEISGPVFGLYGQTGGFISMTTSATPTSLWAKVHDTSNVAFNDIVTDNNGNWLAVGVSPQTSITKRQAAYSASNGTPGTWTEIDISSNVTFTSVATYGGSWVAIGNSPAPVAYTTANPLGTWTQSTLIGNTLISLNSVDAGQDDVPCFLKGTMIRTASGESAIETLKEGDEVLTTTGEVKAITHIQRATVPPTEETCPYKIPAGDLGATQDLYISPTHGVRTAGGETVEAQFLGYPQEKMDTPVEYYNISIGRLRSELIYANGVAVESMGEDGKNVVADVSTYSQERIFTEEVRAGLIDNLNKKMKISYDKLVSYPDSYLQELLSR
jgi:hypothetical protein